MPIDFNQQRWDNVKENYRKWWAGELERPLIQVWLKGKEPQQQKPLFPCYNFASFYGPDTDVGKIIDCWDYTLCSTKFMGDAFPCIFPNFGPGVTSAFLGADLYNGIDTDTVWFHSKEELEISDITFNYDPNNLWLKRVKDVFREAVKRYGKQVQIAMTDLGGNLDILAPFRPSEKLLLDLYDHPQEVQRLNWQIHKLWRQYFDELNNICKPTNPGYSSWAYMFSEEPHYILQCDFSYMIGPKQFEEFVKPELKATAESLTNVFYHLDGPGQLAHLDSLLEIEAIKGIQWVPGAGNPQIDKWPEIYRKIRKAGKLIQIISNQYSRGFDVLDILADQLGSAKGIIYTILDADDSKQNDLEKLLEKYNC